jgi:hypothetical protein
MRIPVHQTFAAIDIPIAEHAEESFPYGSRADGIEGEAGSPPIATGTDFAKLAKNAGLISVFPGPDPLHQFLAAEIVAGLLFLREDQPLNHGLRGDPRVVGAGHPESIVTLHSPPADQYILECVIECVPHVERAGHIRRRDDDGVRFARGVRIAMEIAAFFPERQPLFLCGFGVIDLGKFDGHMFRFRV